MKILLCYSLDHFDPSLPKQKQKNWGTSANILAREFYSALSKMGDVTYSDGFDYEKHRGEKYDLFVGPDRNFHKILEVCDIKKSILIGVNMHPAERNRIIKNFAEKELRDPNAIPAGDLVDEDDAKRSINMADFILCDGNIAVYNSYIKNGVPRNKVKVFNYGLLEKVPSIQKPKNKPRILYSASRIGLRKGFDIVESLVYGAENSDFHLDIVGMPSSEQYARQINQLVKKMAGKVTYHGYVPAHTQKYRKLYQANDFLLFPSLEEGQAGTAIEATYFGLVPLLSAESGVDFSPLGFLETKMNSQVNREIFKKALSMNKKDVVRWKAKSQQYYVEFHQESSQHIEEMLRNCINGQLYPKVSLILAIYNKAPVIKDLVKLTDKAAKEYGNVEAHIIFDGCTDNSEAIVKSYYKHRNDYPIKFYTTPNIFEVKSNNLGLRNSTGKYSVIIQDDNFVYDKYFLYEAVQFLDKAPKVAVLGGLAGVNFYPIGTKLKGSGQISMSDIEVYWRQDENTDPQLKNRVFEVDACMRGPLFFRKSFLEIYGYLDEAYAPLQQDDMDLCFRARKYGYRVYAMLMDAANKSMTIARYDEEKSKFFADNLRDHLKLFYSRWQPSSEKDYLWLNRVPLWRPGRKKFWKGIANALR